MSKGLQETAEKAPQTESTVEKAFIGREEAHECSRHTENNSKTLPLLSCGTESL